MEEGPRAGFLKEGRKEDVTENPQDLRQATGANGQRSGAESLDDAKYGFDGKKLALVIGV